MNEKEMLQKLMDIGTEMRAAQKGFFKAKGKKEKQDFLIKSKRAESIFDNALFNIRQILK